MLNEKQLKQLTNIVKIWSSSTDLFTDKNGNTIAPHVQVEFPILGGTISRDEIFYIRAEIKKMLKEIQMKNELNNRNTREMLEEELEPK